MQLIVTPEATKQFTKLPKVEQKKIAKKLNALESDPYAGKKLEGELSETRSLRAWPYRIIYWIDKKHKKLFVVNIQHRQGVYK